MSGPENSEKEHKAEGAQRERERERERERDREREREREREKLEDDISTEYWGACLKVRGGG